MVDRIELELARTWITGDYGDIFGLIDRSSITVSITNYGAGAYRRIYRLGEVGHVPNRTRVV